ncbi:hypothetical protein LGK97_14055 [Clostridium sp. CS001]|uniref:hypothetical protein n=1 Tax=Clostridium sp. CS001 TaxID=2880648 RepID=UPI001CF5E043|nr:hypothetical protein [Clostridium sp. CS001]MCB2290866.1 hypothetical protein [Clostridium sp. CS001]
MAINRNKNKTSDTILTRTKTTIPQELFETEGVRRNKELLELLLEGRLFNKRESVILTITSFYKDKESCYKSNFKEREFYNQNYKLIAKYTDNPNSFSAFVEGYLKALYDNKIKYVINEDVFVD